MKKLIKDPLMIFITGGLGFTITNLSENLYVHSILRPIFIFIQLIGLFFMIKNYLKEKKVEKQEGKNTTDK